MELPPTHPRGLAARQRCGGAARRNWLRPARCRTGHINRDGSRPPARTSARVRLSACGGSGQGSHHDESAPARDHLRCTVIAKQHLPKGDVLSPVHQGLIRVRARSGRNPQRHDHRPRCPTVWWRFACNLVDALSVISCGFIGIRYDIARLGKDFANSVFLLPSQFYSQKSFACLCRHREELKKFCTPLDYARRSP